MPKDLANDFFIDIKSVPKIQNIESDSHKILRNSRVRQKAGGFDKIGSYSSAPQKHDPKAMKIADKMVKLAKMTKQADGASDIHFMGPEFYHPELEPTSLMVPRDPFIINQYCRHFYREDPLIAACIDLHTELSLTKFHLVHPEFNPDLIKKEKVDKIIEFYQNMVNDIDLFAILLSISHEYWKLGNVFPFAQWNDKTKRFEKIIILNPDDIKIETIPFIDAKQIYWIPTEEVRRVVNNGPIDQRTGALFPLLPDQLIEYVRNRKDIPLDTDPLLGSHVSHLSFKRSNYEIYGVPLMHRLFKTLMYKDKLIKAQNQIAMRNMSPKHIVWGDNLDKTAIEDLRTQVENSMQDPDYAIVTNFEVHWEQVEHNNRILQLTTEYEQINNEIYIGMGLSSGLITGEGHYAGEYINLTIVNEKYARWTEIIQNYVEKCLFYPVAYHNNFYYEVPVKKINQNGKVTLIKEKRYIYPKVRWDRIHLIDDRDHKAMLTSLYDNGKIDNKTFFELNNINYDEVKERLRKERETGDAYMPDVVKNVSSMVATNIVPYVTEMIVKKMGLDGIKKELETQQLQQMPQDSMQQDTMPENVQPEELQQNAPSDGTQEIQDQGSEQITPELIEQIESQNK